MKLRRQLLLVSSLALALPWAGCEYIREMEHTLRQSQASALEATARAVAARLGSDPATRELIIEATAKPAGKETQPLYAHPLRTAPFIDGYDDWRNLMMFEEQTFVAPAGAPPFAIQVLAGRHDEHLYLFCRITDTSPRYYSPMRPIMQSDHLQLWVAPENGEERPFSIITAAPGNVTVLSHTGKREHRVSGVWQEWQDGFQVELRLPLAWAQGALGLTAVNASDEGTRELSSFAPGALPPLMSQRPELNSALAVFVEGENRAEDGTLLRLATPQSWLIAEAGERLQEVPPEYIEGNQLLTRLYRMALGDQQFPVLESPTGTGRLASEEVRHALAGQAAATWYQSGNQQVVRVAIPIEANSLPIAAIIAEQSTDTLRAMTNSAFSRLVSYSLAAFAFAGFGLITYASWLSWRIRRLSKAAEAAVDANGRITQHFPRSRSQDELGELSRRYGDLLERLRQYNSYLESLASKLSHELRTPLAVVRSSLDNLEHENLSPQAATYSDRAKEGAERLSKILTAMSAASRVEQSIRAAELETVDLKALLTDLTAAYRDVYPHVHWQLSVDEESYDIFAAPDLLVQLLDKLADNAADFCPAGQTIRISLQQNTEQVVVSVANPGPSLPEHMRGQLFDSLVSVREGQSQGHHLGLGLYIVRLIADFHHGKVAADNLTGDSGAIFTLQLPKALRADTQLPSPHFLGGTGASY
jgi:two-component system sensor histidine kinase ChvG